MGKLKSYIPVIVVIVLAVALVGGSALYMGKAQKGTQLSSDEIGEKVIDFINVEILRGQATANLISVIEENNLYKIKFDIQGQEIESYSTMDGKLFFPEAIDLTQTSDLVQETDTTVGDFSVSGEDIITENGKPIVYFFGSESCPHCTWEEPIISKVMEEFKDQISFHFNKDSDNDQDIFNKYSDGGIPTLVFGGKYYRIGSGENSGEEE
jgi:thiol-disulfide isomerase/thioredoxin